MRMIRKSLALTFAATLVTSLAAAQGDQPEYIGHNQCKVCHDKKPEGAQWSVWKELDHAKAFETLKGDEAKKIAEERGLTRPPHEAPECVKCHVTAYDLDTEALPAKLKPEDSVQCEACHGPGENHVTDGRDVMFKKKTADEVDWMANLMEITEETCTQCHNDESPTWDTTRYTLEDGTTAAFDFEQAKEKIAHPNPTKAEE